MGSSVGMSKLKLYIYIFILIMTVKASASRPPTTGCSLKFEPLTSSYHSNYQGGDWGGFLNRSCCGAAFHSYLYALGLRANQTGLIYLNSGEQRSCLVSMKRFDEDIFSCGIEKLTSGAGGCSDYSMADVNDNLGDELRRLSENCGSLNMDGGTDQQCGSCVRSWWDIEGTDLCRFVVLVSLASNQTGDDKFIERIGKCIQKNNMDTENKKQTEPTVTMKKQLKPEIWVLIGGIPVIITIAVASVWIFSKKQRKLNLPLKKPTFKNLVLKEPGCQKLGIKEVYAATNSLDVSNCIGEGTAGRVYKGVLPNNQPVAVKHIISDGSVETFVREVTSLSQVRHPNLVTLLGYCLREDECFLIYEMCPNGNLSQWLFGKDKLLTWIQRLEIAIGSARALWFLHTYPEGSIVHRDIKPTNILLGQDFEAKLSDFGLSKVIDLGETYVSSEIRGTFGYVDPEYQNNRRVNTAGDVYSFGIVLLQILSGKKVVNLNLTKPMPLSKMARALHKGGSIEEFADPRLAGEYSKEAFDLTFRLALSCTRVKQERPSMEKVVEILQKALEISTKAESSPDLDFTP